MYWTEDKIRAALDEKQPRREKPIRKPDPPRPVMANQIDISTLPNAHLGDAQFRAICETVCSLTGITTGAIFCASRNKAVTRARHMIYFLVRNINKYSLPRIGTLMARDHATILYGVKKVGSERAYFEPEITLAENQFNQREAA